MATERHLQLLELLSDGSGGVETGRLCAVSAEVTGADGAGIMLMSGDIPQGSLCATNSVSARIEDLQFELGEGPCVDAYRTDRPVLEPDLVHPHEVRWVAFAEQAIGAGARAVFGFPISIGEVRLGALNLYRDRRGPLSDEQHGDALSMTAIIVRTVLAVQADAPPGQLAKDLESNADFRSVVHQASGMVAAQLDTTVGQALIRLRARAFADDVPLADLAEAVVARTLRFEKPPEEGDA